ncbi:MAG: dockerin type 1, partial [Crenarchaeota archaeon]|nr:dockerin type 1 [Thermoproteota archaeon]
ILINSTDDGINAAGGNDGSSNDWMPGFGGQGMARPGGMGTTTTGNYYLKILNGFIYIDALGDGIDINGYIEMSGGTLIINGPTSDNEGPIDYDSSFSISGGTLIAVGSSGMAQAPSSTSTQYSVSLSLSTKQTAGQLITIQDSNGNTVVSIRPTKTYQCLIYSSANLNQATYNLYIAGTNTGNLEHSIYQNGTYQNGTLYGTFTISNIVSAFR